MYCFNFVHKKHTIRLNRNTQLSVTSKECLLSSGGERGGLVVESPTLEREVRGSIPTSAVLCH